MTGREKLMMAVCAAMGLSASTAAMGQISYTTAGSSYTQNFDSLPSTGTSGTWADNTTLPGWFAVVGSSPHAATVFTIDIGSSNTGGLHDYGDASSTDRALGSIGSANATNATNIYYGFMLVNNTTQTLDSFTLSYFGEQWRHTAAAANTLEFAYSMSATTVGGTTGFTTSGPLSFTSPKTAAGTDTAIGGNDPANRVAISSTVPIIGGWAPGATLVLRWYDKDDTGSDHGLGIDDLSFSATFTPPSTNNSHLFVAGSKTPPPVSVGRVVAGSNSHTQAVTLSNTGSDSTGYLDYGTNGAPVAPSPGTVPANGSTSISVGLLGAVLPATAIGSDVTQNAIVKNTGNTGDANVEIPVTAHVVGNRFVDNFDMTTLTGGSQAAVDFGKMLVGSTKTVNDVVLYTINTNTADYSPNSLTTVQLPAGAVTGFAGGSTSGFATVTMAAGANGDVTFDGAEDMDTRNVTLTVIQSGIVKSGALGGERTPGFLSIPIVQLDTAAGASGDARVYVRGDFYAAAGIDGGTTAIAPGGTVTLTNTLPPTADSTSGKRLGAEVTGVSFNQSGWSVGTIATGTTIGASRASYSQGTPSTNFPAVTPSVSGTVSFDTTGKINGVYGASLTVALQNDQTAGVYGVTANDLPSTAVPLAATVTDKPAVQNGAYSLNGGTLSAPATNLTGSFSQSGGDSTFASVIGGGSVSVTGGTLTLSPGATTNLVGSLTISGTGKVDLTSAKLAINYTGSTPANAVRLALLAGSASGWTGATGLTSSDAAAHTAGSYAIGYAEASLVLGAGGGTWNGASVDGTALLIKETYFGDANLDGKVNADDYTLLDKGRAKNLAAGTARWTDGDFNYDGTVNAADYLLTDTAFAQHGAPLSAEFLAMREAEFGTAYVANLIAAVPEPTSLGLVGVAAAGLLGRRRRSAK